MLGALLTTWTIRLALACYVGYLAGWLVTGQPRWSNFARWLWTMGCGLFVLHVVCAFAFHHHWSHAAAWKTTADETRDLLGVAFGDGIYFSYLFTVLWVSDVVWLWLPRRSSGQQQAGNAPRTPWTRVLVHAYLFFIAFNGAIVFEGGPTRWAGLIVCPALACLAARRLYNDWRSPTPDMNQAASAAPSRLTSDL